MRDPTNQELLLGAVQIQNDVDWYTWRDSAVRQGYADFESDYEQLCVEAFGFVPKRIHNLGTNNIWNYPPGPACCWPENMGPLPPGPFTQPQIDALNACAPVNSVVAWNAVDPVEVATPTKPEA